MKRLTLEQIGELADVSRSTVSRVINGQDGVRPIVRERVLQVIAETGYQPNPVARSLAGQSSKILGLVIPQTAQILFTDPYFPRLIQGISRACHAHDYMLTLFLFDDVEQEHDIYKRVLHTHLLDGLILTATQQNDELINQLLERDVPFVLVGQHQNPRVNFVDADNRAGAYTAVRHLIRLGYKRIATITGLDSNLASVHRLEGYQLALRDAGHKIDTNLIVSGMFTERGGYKAMSDLLAEMPEAVFVASDAMAVGALRALRHQNISIPEQIALVGYDDLPPASTAEPPLTTIRQPIYRAGLQAVELLLDSLKVKNYPTQRVILPTELIIRQTCGATQVNKGGRY